MESNKNQSVESVKNGELTENQKSKKGITKKQLIILISIIAAVVIGTALALVLILVNRGKDDPNEQADRYAAGTYYYSADGIECELSLKDDGKFTISFNGKNDAGTYTLNGSAITLTFDRESKGSVTATFENRVVTLTYDGATMRMLEKVSYTVTFATNGGSVIAPVTVLNGKTVNKPSDPAREEYLFVGWYKDAAFTVPYTFGADTVLSNTTIYARWVKKTANEKEYTVSFDPCLTGISAPESKRTIGAKLFDVPALAKDGFEFCGWWISTENDSEKPSYRYDEDTVFDSDTTLYALWKEKGSAKLDPPSIKINGSSVSWSAVKGVRSYDVSVTDANGNTVFTKSTASTSLDARLTEYDAGVYYVKVTANANTGSTDSSEAFFTYYNKVLDKVDGIFVDSENVLVFDGVENAEKYLITVVCGDSEHNHVDFDNKNSKTFSFVNCPMTEDGISFVIKAVADGYVSSVSEKFVYKRELSAVTDFVWSEQNATLSWSPVKRAEYYVISVTCGDSEHNHKFLSKNINPTLDLKECTSRDGGISITVYPVAEGYISPEPSSFVANKTALKTPAQISLNGTVISWSADALASGYEVKVNGTVYQCAEAQFDLSPYVSVETGKKYEISLRSVGESSSAWSNTVSIFNYAMGAKPEYSNNTVSWNHVIGADFYEVQLNEGEIIKVENYLFAKISLTKAGENTVKVRFADGEYRSDWSTVSVIAYSVSFDSMGGDAIATQYKALGDEIELPSADRAGYNFLSWYNVSGGPLANGKKITDNVFKSSENTVLYAHYEPKEFEVTYDYGNGGTGLGVKGKVKYNRHYTLEIPVANEVTTVFGGWFSAPYGKGARYTDGMGNSVAPWTDLSDVQLYAFWVDETLKFEPAKVNGRDVYAVSAGTRVALINEVTVPAYHNGLPVAVISAEAFANCKSLKRINIPETVEVISSVYPFSGCSSLTEINVYSVEGVSSSRYTSFEGVLFETRADGSLAMIGIPEGRRGDYIIPEGVDEIAEGAFENSSIGSVTIPTSVVKIANDAFVNAKNLKAVSFELSAVNENVDSLIIGKRAFSGCESLESIKLPARLSEIELTKYYVNVSGNPVLSTDYAFVGCTKLNSISIAEGSSTYKTIDGMIYSADGRTLLYCPVSVSGEVTVPARTQSISAGAFIGCDGMTKVVIPNTVTYIGEYAFYSLGITELVFTTGGFNEITIGNNAFKNCANLTAVSHRDKNNAETENEFALISVIGSGAFSGCKKLHEFTVCPSVTTIRDNAFENCAELSLVKFMPSVRALEFGKDVFYNCTSLTSVEMPANVSKIPGIFGGCSNLTEVKIAGDSKYFTSDNGVIFNKDKTEIIYYPQGKAGAYEIPDTVRTIASGVFSGNQKITELIIPNSVSYIGEEAFKGTKIGKIVFSGGAMAESLTIARAAFKNAYFENYDFILPAHTKHIEAYAFSEIFFSNIVLNEGLETIGDYAFFKPSNVNGSITIPASVTSIGEYCFSGESISYNGTFIDMFVNPIFTKENSSLTEIGDFAFYQNPKITALYLPDSVKTIGNYAFYECKNISSLTLSASLETIGAYAFASGSYSNQLLISTLEIPKGVTSIGARAFENCQSLTSVTFSGTVSSPDLVIGTTYLRSYTENGIEMFAVERGNVFASCRKLLTVNLSPNVTVLWDYTFASAGDEGFTVNLTADSRLSTIGAYCFYKSALTKFTVPATVRNLAPIKDNGIDINLIGIGEYAFAVSSGKLTEIVFLKGETDYPLTIGAFAFENQSKLEAIELPARLAPYTSHTGNVIAPLENGPLVFNGASSLASVSVEKESKTYVALNNVLYTFDMTELVFCPVLLEGAVEVPSSVIKIHSYAFSGCASVSSVIFKADSKLNYIGEYAFNGCSAIGSIVLPEGVTAIGEGAFNYCGSLESITLSKNLRSFNVEVIGGCSSLKNVFVGEGSVSLVSLNGVLYNADKTVLICYPMGRTEVSYTVDGSVKTIGEYAFFGNGKLETLILPLGLVKISDGAFAYCTALSTVVIPKTVDLIGAEAFASNAALVNLTFEKGGTEKLIISSGAFKNAGLIAIELPARLAVIDKEAFLGTKLATLTFEMADSYQLTEIGSDAFKGTAIVSVEFPKGVEKVGSGAFADTTELEKVVFGEGLKELGDSVFNNSGLGEIYIPATIKIIGIEAFYNCNRLLSVVFGENADLEIIPEGAFFGCSALKSITIPAYVKEIGGKKGNGAFYNCTSLEAVIFESDINCEIIGDYAFYGCSKLNSVTLPVSAEVLGKYAFAGCTALKKISIPITTTKLGEGLFEGCASLSDVDLSTGASVLPENMFKDCVNITYISIPVNVSEIGKDCFSGTSIESFDVVKGNISFVAISGIVYNYAKTEIVCFPPNSTATTLFIPKEIINIPAGNFENCTNIKDVVFEEGGTLPLSIGDKAFAGCHQLRTLVLPERLVSIGKYAFKECYALTSVTIPEKVTSIGDYAFMWCYKLYEVRNESSIENIASKGSIGTAQANVHIYTPGGTSVLSREGDYLFATVNGVKTLIGYEGNERELILPDGNYTLAPYLFYREKTIKRVIVPNTVSINDDTVFSQCEALEMILVSGGSAPSSWIDGWNSKTAFVEGYTGLDNTYTFHTEGEAITPVTAVGPITLPKPVLDGYVFMGWYDNDSFLGEAYTGLYYSADKTDLYAKFMLESDYIELYLRGQSMEYAYEIVSGSKYPVKINSKKAQNYYAITVSAGDVLNILTDESSGSHKIWIYDENGNVIMEYDSRTTYHVDYDYTFTKAGTYYIGVGYKGDATGSFGVKFTEK